MRSKGKAARNEGGSPSEEKVKKNNKTISLFFSRSVFLFRPNLYSF